MPAQTDDKGDFLSSAHVRKRYGDRSQMWIVRRLKDDPTFPKPVFIGRLRFWRLADLIEWERSKAVAA
jgi:predicted DNA-binding transcriptional regulator AlpA